MLIVSRTLAALAVVLYEQLMHHIQFDLLTNMQSLFVFSSMFIHSNDLPYKFAVNVEERQDRLPTMYWLPKLHKRPYKARFIANSSSCTTTELSKLITSCLTAIKAKVIQYCDTVYERSGKICFGL